ncbi:hypothetical protein HOF92_02475 [bacterium]|nr:hypothetical protein [bacterium]
MPGGVPMETLMSFYNTLAIALNAGAPLMQALSAYKEQNTSAKFDKVLDGITTDVGSGKPFSEALVKFPKIFPKEFQSLVTAGEMSGQLDKLLVEYVEFAEGQQKLKAKFISACMYPAVMAIIAVAVTLGLTLGIFPKFMQSLNLKPENMPGITLFVKNFSDFMINRWLEIIISFGATVFGLVYAVQKTPQGAKVFDFLAFNSPIIGDLFKKYFVSRFVHTLSSQLRGGVPGL